VGRGAQKKRAFLAAHPFCCYCGGANASAEPDHMPSRVLFDARQWPEGFEFPSCVVCNRATRHDEQVIAMLSRMYPDAVTPGEKAEQQERIRAVAHNYPSVLEEMRPSLEQLRRAETKYGIRPGPGETRRDLPLLSVRGPLINAAVENFARKLFCALYYKHAAQIIPPAGGIAVQWFTNIQIDNDEIPRELASVLVEFPKLERSRTKLDDQFFYRFGVPDTKSNAIFLAFFRRSFAILGLVNIAATDLTLGPNAKILHPYEWKKHADDE
jgi:hypothetical protein